MNERQFTGYGQGLGQLGGATVATQQFPQTEPTPPGSIMDVHLAQLRSVNSGLYAALERAMKIADRLIGPVPQNITGTGQNAKEAAEPPVSRKLTTAADELGRLTEALHQQLSRLEQV